jgi:hypothetical protein
MTPCGGNTIITELRLRAQQTHSKPDVGIDSVASG